MGVQSELLAIGGKIISQEPVALDWSRGNTPRAFWENTKAFTPGLAIEAEFASVDLSVETIARIGFVVVNLAEGTEVNISVSTDTRCGQEYETAYDRWVLDAFTKYMGRQDPNEPAGFYSNYLEHDSVMSIRPVTSVQYLSLVGDPDVNLEMVPMRLILPEVPPAKAA